MTGSLRLDNILIRTGNTKGSCFSSGRCSGTPPECRDCNKVKDCEMVCIWFWLLVQLVFHSPPSQSSLVGEFLGSGVEGSTPSGKSSKYDFYLKWSKRVQNGQKQLGWPFWAFMDPFGPLGNVDKSALFGPKWAIFGPSPVMNCALQSWKRVITRSSMCGLLVEPQNVPFCT